MDKGGNRLSHAPKDGDETPARTLHSLIRREIFHGMLLPVASVISGAYDLKVA